MAGAVRWEDVFQLASSVYVFRGDPLQLQWPRVTSVDGLVGAVATVSAAMHGVYQSTEAPGEEGMAGEAGVAVEVKAEVEADAE